MIYFFPSGQVLQQPVMKWWRDAWWSCSSFLKCKNSGRVKQPTGNWSSVVSDRTGTSFIVSHHYTYSSWSGYVTTDTNRMLGAWDLDNFNWQLQLVSPPSALAWSLQQVLPELLLPCNGTDLSDDETNSWDKIIIMIILQNNYNSHYIGHVKLPKVSNIHQWRLMKVIVPNTCHCEKGVSWLRTCWRLETGSGETLTNF